MVYLSSTDYCVHILKSMMVASRQLFYLIKLTFLRVYPSLKPHILFYSNHLASFPDISHIKVNNGLNLATLNLIELIFFGTYPSYPLQCEVRPRPAIQGDSFVLEGIRMSADRHLCLSISEAAESSQLARLTRYKAY